MRYYHVSFHYRVSKEEIDASWKEDPENKGQYITSPAQSHAAWMIETFLDAFFVGMGLKMRHAYSWPDGSCYKYVAFDGKREELTAKIDHLLRRGGKSVPYHLRVESMDEVEKDYALTHERDAPTVEDLKGKSDGRSKRVGLL